jgi:peptidoglycan-associated lipoprotein
VDGFSKPENLKYPINTPYDDFGIIFEDQDELRGYLSSNRKGKQWKARGGDDIYFIDKQLIFFEMSGFIMDTTINEPISGVNIQLTGTDGSMHSTITDGKGAFNIPSDKFKEGAEYQIQFKKDFYLTQRDTISTVNIDRLKCKELEDGNLVFKFERYVQMKSTRRPIILPEVQYDLGKATLREAGKKALDGLADLLTKDHPEIVIELRSHTDLRGSKQLNKKLSEERAQSCVDYLVEQGVSPDRLIPVGRSYYEPFEDEQGNKFTSKYISQLSINLQESAHQKNRRTDFKVLSTNLDDYKKEIENKERPIQDAIIDEEGNLIEITD